MDIKPGRPTWPRNTPPTPFLTFLRAETRPYVPVAAVKSELPRHGHGAQSTSDSGVRVGGKLDDATRQQYGHGR
jgi:hypothetical protein